MKKIRLVLNIVSVLLFVIQILGYIGTINNPPNKDHGIYKMAYVIGFNFPVLLAGTLFLISLRIKRKLRKKEVVTLINSIGQE